MGALSTPKRIVITGASRGIGRATAIALARRGHRVVLAARNGAALRCVADEIVAMGGAAEIAVLDVTDDASVARATAAIVASGPCDVLVNNAGSCQQRDFLAQSVRDRRDEMELNYWGALRVTEALLPSMLQRGSGVVVNVSSLLGVVASPTTANYSATKAALNAWSHALRGEIARFGVRVVVFVAPHTQTENGAATKFEGVVSLPVEHTARELVRAIDRAPRQHVGSPMYRVLVRLAGIFPSFLEARIAASARGQLMAAYPWTEHRADRATKVPERTLTG